MTAAEFLKYKVHPDKTKQVEIWLEEYADAKIQAEISEKDLEISQLKIRLEIAELEKQRPY